MRNAVLAALLAFAPLGATVSPSPVLAQAETYPISTAELMKVTALDQVFTHFGAAIESAPDEQPVAFNAAMRGAWSEATREIFTASQMHRRLAEALDDKFETEDYEVYAAFFGSPFGLRVSETEQAVTALPPEAQEAVRQRGLELAAAGDERRHEQVEEMLRLVSAEIATEMVRQSVRGMLIGMSVNGQQGDIEVPWEEIDAQLDAIMPGIAVDIAETQRAMMFFAYRDFTEADLDAYLEFLRTEAAQKLYAVAAYSVGEIVTERMEAFGEALATKLSRVNV